MDRKHRALAIQAGVAILVTICLGAWQVTRALAKYEQKRDIESRLSSAPLTVADFAYDDLDYRQFVVRGRLDSTRYFLVHGQYHEGRNGLWVMGLIDTDVGRFIVNRGWISVPANARVEPAISQPDRTLDIKGVFWPYSEPTRPNDEPLDHEWPIHLPHPDIQFMAGRTGAHSIELRLSGESDGVLIPAPLKLEFSAAMHWSYAVQWLFIGALIAGGFWFFIIRRDDKEDKYDD